ncbi:DUF4258 domain-containing protein [Spongiimicrobium sp. 3-5]|uniref:DUF4258 domain-containing protein n=1 Tax=Spongiimicrobium sp. 3-5 TaxID=3332596 RepID=UPI00397FFCBD
MAFLKRLGFYLFGLAIGLIFLAFFFKKKSEETGVEFCYLPNCRVLKDLRSKPWEYSKTVEQLLNAQTLDSTDIAYFLKEGDIDFNLSDTEAKPCKTYIIESEIGDKNAVLQVKNCLENIVIEEVSFPN